MDTKLERVLAHDMGRPLKKPTPLLVKRAFFYFFFFFFAQPCTLVLYKGTVRLLLLVREQELPVYHV